MIDFTHPLFSAERCELLKLLPDRNKKGWQSQFISNLRQNANQFKAALSLADYLDNPKVSHYKFMNEIHQYQQYLSQFLTTEQGLKASYLHLVELRKSVYSSELSQNPKGQILEPGFRVIFPERRI